MKGELPQLRVRTEYSFRSCYGPVPLVTQTLAKLDCPAAGIVDAGGTWGHVQWEQSIGDVEPMFGREFRIELENGFKPSYWVLAEELGDFYAFSSLATPTPEQLARWPHLVRFAGAALTDPELFDYVDINPRSRRQAQRSIALAKRTRRPLVVTSDNDYPAPEHRDRFLAWDDSKKMTPQHIMSRAELEYEFCWMDRRTLNKAINNTFEVAERCSDLKLARAPMIHFEGDFDALVRAGKKYRLDKGHIERWTQDYEKRLQREMELIKQKEFTSYFMVVADMICWAKERMLVGPARGSSAGSLVCYLLRITEVDPLVHGLLFERFIDVNRLDIPDIDVDFNDKKRELVFDYLANKYGRDCVARIGSINRLKPRSVMAHVGKKLGIPRAATFSVTNVLIEYSSGDSRYGKGLEDTLNNTQPGQDFVVRYPEAELMTELEEHASHSGVHAAGIIVSNEPVNRYCTVNDGIAQLDKKEAEYLNLLKIDALGLRTLGVIEDSGCTSAEKLYDLRLDEQDAFDVINQKKFCGVFQFEGAAQRRVAMQIPVKSCRQLDHITALARPGPLGGGAAGSYINRNAGRERVAYRHPSMKAYLDDTMGVVLYQEQVMRIVREIGNFSWEDTSTIRKAMSGRKGKEFFDKHGERFVKGASRLGIGAEDAKAIWDEICSFGAWGMNKSHTVSYAIISYWCAHMKCHHQLEYAAACLRNAKDDEQVIELLRELRDEHVDYVPFDHELSQADWCVRDGKLVGGFVNLVGIGPSKAAALIKRREEGKLKPEQLAKYRLKFNDLNPAHTLWGHLYERPALVNVNDRIKQISELEDEESAVVICKLVRLERRDENETVRLARRGFRKEGQTLFLDAFVVDDSVSKPVVLRVHARHWHAIGKPMADRSVPEQDWFLVRGRWLSQFSMLVAQKVRCLTNERMFQ